MWFRLTFKHYLFWMVYNLKYMRSVRDFLCLWLLLFCALPSFAQERIEKSYTFHYRVNSSDIDSTYIDNARVLRNLRDDINTVLDTQGMSLDSLYIYALSSPEGNRTVNDKLAKERAESAKSFLIGQFPELSKCNIRMESGISGWEGLLQLLREDTSLVHKDVLIRILEDSQIQDKTAAMRAEVKAYAEVREWIFNHMRMATVTFHLTYEPVEVQQQTNTPEPEISVSDSPIKEETPVAELEIKEEVKHSPNFYMAIKNNMIYDLAAVPNIGLEFYLGKNFSISGNWMYSWWSKDSIPWYWRIYGGDIAVRYWLGKAAKKKPLTGHHVGLYGQILTYDFQLGGRGYLGDRWSYAGGVEYGYSLPIARRLNFDFTVGVGYLGGEYKEYLPIDGHHVWQATKYRHLIGPTKAEISLVWLIGRGNTNERR